MTEDEKLAQMGVITDHEHEHKMVGRWRTAYCTCGARTSAHLSWGKSLAEILGGDPLDYIQPR